MKLPKHVPVMQLPDAVLFPRVLLPLYIFEPQYKQMLADCLQGDRMFAVALLQPDGQRRRQARPYRVATVGVIRTCIQRPDGSANLILEGMVRVNLGKAIQRQPYLIARVSPLASIEPEGSPARRRLVSAVSKLARARARFGAKVPKSVLSSMLAVSNPDYLSDLVSYTLLENSHQKQLMLETLDVHQRMEKLVDLLQKQVQQFELWKVLQGKLPSDHVGYN